MNARHTLIAVMLALGLGFGALAQERTLRLLTWSDYVPAEVKTQFEQESGYKVEVTVASSNDEMIAKLRAAGEAPSPGGLAGSGGAQGDSANPIFDLVQPALDRVTGAQREHRLYKPIEPGRVRQEQLIEVLLAAARRNSTVDGRIYALPHIWGTDGLVVNTKLARMTDYPDLCRAQFKGKTTLRLRRQALLAFAFAAGKDPFALYGNPKAYAALMASVGKTLAACKENLKFTWDDKDRLLDALRSGQVFGALMWDTGGWKLNAERPDIRFIAPASGALGWVDTFAIPAKGRNDEAAYAWINFNLRPDIAAKVADHTGNLTASRGADAFMDERRRAQFAASFPPRALERIRWYPALPAVIEQIEDRVLHRIRADD